LYISEKVAEIIKIYRAFLGLIKEEFFLIYNFNKFKRERERESNVFYIKNSDKMWNTCFVRQLHVQRFITARALKAATYFSNEHTSFLETFSTTYD